MKIRTRRTKVVNFAVSIRPAGPFFGAAASTGAVVDRMSDGAEKAPGYRAVDVVAWMEMYTVLSGLLHSTVSIIETAGQRWAAGQLVEHTDRGRSDGAPGALRRPAPRHPGHQRAHALVPSDGSRRSTRAGSRGAGRLGGDAPPGGGSEHGLVHGLSRSSCSVGFGHPPYQVHPGVLETRDRNFASDVQIVRRLEAREGEQGVGEHVVIPVDSGLSQQS